MSGASPPADQRMQPIGEGGVDCRSLDFPTTLASPDPDGVDALKAGDVLEVDLIEERGVTVIGVRPHDGTVVGTVVFDQAAQLRSCLQEGFQFQARVISVEGGIVRVQISAR